MNKRVVITGFGVVSPIGSNIETFKNSIMTGKSGIKYISELEAFGFESRIGGIPEINQSKYYHLVDKYQLSQADSTIKYAVIAGIDAWISAGLDIPDYYDCDVNKDFGSIIGTCFGGMEIFIRKLYPMINEKKIKNLGSLIVEQWMLSGASATLSKILALANQTTTNSSACSTGTEAIIMAHERIKHGSAKLMLAGGSDPYSPFCWAGFDSMHLLSRTNNEFPEKASRPMSQTASGFVASSGCGIVILEELEHALHRNAQIFAEITGASINSGGQRNGGSMTISNPKRVIDLIKDAIYQAKISGEDIDLIAGHLTGTKADPYEVKNWVLSLGLHHKYPYINSLKSMTGHMIGAAGAVEIIAAILQMHHNFIHPSINCEDLHTEIEKIYPKNKIPQKVLLNQKINYIIKASYGFGDVNSCIILKKYV